MRVLRWAIPLCFAFLSATAFSSEMRLPVPKIEELPNGLQVVWFIDPSLPVIDLSLTVKSGYRDDPQGKSGTVELLSSALDRGAGGLTAQQFARSVEALGATRFIVAEDDSLSLGMHGLAPDATTLLDLLAKVALKPDFPTFETQREHARILDRWSHVLDDGESLVTLAYRRALTARTSYGRGNFLSIREFRSVGREDVVAFHQKHFTPKNSILTVVGRVDPVSFRQEILRLLGTQEAWKGEAPKRDWRLFSDPRLPSERDPKTSILLIDRPGLTQSQLRIGFRAPLLNSPEHYPLSVGNALLGEHFNSRLNSLIRDRLGLTYDIGSSFVYSKDLASFTIATSTQTATTTVLLQRVMDVLRELKQKEIPIEEVETAKTYLQGGFPLVHSTLSSVAARWLAGRVLGMGPDYLNEFVPQVQAVTSAQVMNAVKAHFDLDHLVIVVAGDGKTIEKSLKETRLAPVYRVDAKRML